MMTIDCMTQDVSSSVRVRNTGFAAHVVFTAHTFLKLYSALEEEGLKKSRTSRFDLINRNFVLMMQRNISSMIIIFFLSVSV